MEKNVGRPYFTSLRSCNEPRNLQVCATSRAHNVHRTLYRNFSFSDKNLLVSAKKFAPTVPKSSKQDRRKEKGLKLPSSSFSPVGWSNIGQRVKNWNSEWFAKIFGVQRHVQNFDKTTNNKKSGS